jgi:hypothetical protein
VYAVSWVVIEACSYPVFGFCTNSRNLELSAKKLNTR